MKDFEQQNEITHTPEPAEPRPSLFTILPYIMLPMAMAAADQTIVSTALPTIAGELGGVSRVSWIVVANLVAGVSAAPVYGQLRDVYGSRRMMVIALSVYMAASLFCAMAPNFELLVLGRFLQGLGGGGLMTLSQAIIGETIPPRERAQYQGYLAAVVVTASVSGPMIGGVLTALTGWRSVFLFNIPLGALALAVTLRGPAHSQFVRRSLSFDFAGLALFLGTIAPLLLALDRLQGASASAVPQATTLLAIAGASLAGLVWQERRAFQPLLPIALLRQRTIWMSDAVAACHGAALVSLATLLPIYLHVTQGASASEAGLALLPVMLGLGSGSMITGKLVSRTGRTAIFPSVGLLLATLLLIHQALVIDSWSRGQMIFWLLIAGLSMGTVMSVVQVTVQSTAGREAIGSAAASVQISRSVGAALGATITTAVLFGALQMGAPGSTQAFTELFSAASTAHPAAPAEALVASIHAAFRWAFLAIAVFTSVGAALAWNIPKRRL